MTPAQRYATKFAKWQARLPRHHLETWWYVKYNPLTYKPGRRRAREDWTSHENWLHNGYGHGIAVPAYEPGPGSDPGLFGGWTMR